jgi:hypothetical protein
VSAAKLRPLAHVGLKDQVAATAIMLCLADRVETIQGDTTQRFVEVPTQHRVVSYGNRLFCEYPKEVFAIVSGSAKLYREYFRDYRTFLSRPEKVCEAIPEGETANVVIVHSDLKKFYDRVRPHHLGAKLRAVANPNDDQEFFALAARVLNWTWHRKDSADVNEYSKQSNLEDFSTVALPQGLVAWLLCECRALGL